MSMCYALPWDRRESFAWRCEQEVAGVSRRPGIRGSSVSERAAQLRLKARNQLFKRRLLARLRSFQKLLQLVAVKAHDNLSVNHGDRGRHVTKLLQFVQRCFIAGNVPIRELNLVLWKKLFHLRAEHSTRLTINDNLFAHRIPPRSAWQLGHATPILSSSFLPSMCVIPLAPQSPGPPSPPSSPGNSMPAT